MEQQNQKQVQQAEMPKDFRYLVRIINTDLDGNKPIGHALLKIKGIGFMYSHAICLVANIDPNKKTGMLKDDEVARLDETIKNPAKYDIPSWMLNRRKDYEDGSDKHLLSADITFAVDNDIKVLKKIKAYRGIRHILGQPVRGQRTKSNFRRNKGKVMGVKRSKIVPGSAEAGKEKDKGKK